MTPEEQIAAIRDALEVFDMERIPRAHVVALDFVAEVRQALGGHHVALPENQGNPRYDRTAYAERERAREVHGRVVEDIGLNGEQIVEAVLESIRGFYGREPGAVRAWLEGGAS